MEHFGLPYNAISDPISAKNNVIEVSEKNSQIYQEIFKSEPDNSVHNFEELN